MAHRTLLGLGALAITAVAGSSGGGDEAQHRRPGAGPR